MNKKLLTGKLFLWKSFSDASEINGFHAEARGTLLNSLFVISLIAAFRA
jgi:hypothetical protein